MQKYIESNRGTIYGSIVDNVDWLEPNVKAIIIHGKMIIYITLQSRTVIRILR